MSINIPSIAFIKQVLRKLTINSAAGLQKIQIIDDAFKKEYCVSSVFRVC